jgi:hypothetical protein
MIRKFLLTAMVLSLAFLGTAQNAQAEVILTFGQDGGGNTISATVDDAAGTTTITADQVAITVTQIAAGITVPFDAFLTLTATSTGDAMIVDVLGSDFVVQSFSGTFTITENADGTGTNYLSGDFTDAVFGPDGGAALTLSAAMPPETVNFTSDVMTDLGDPKGLSLSFANVTPAVHIVTTTGGDTLGEFTSSISGTFSAEVTIIPEPATMALLLTGLPLAAGAIYRRRKMAKA